MTFVSVGTGFKGVEICGSISWYRTRLFGSNGAQPKSINLDFILFARLYADMNFVVCLPSILVDHGCVSENIRKYL